MEIKFVFVFVFLKNFVLNLKHKLAIVNVNGYFEAEISIYFLFICSAFDFSEFFNFSFRFKNY